MNQMYADFLRRRRKEGPEGQANQRRGGQTKEHGLFVPVSLSSLSYVLCGLRQVILPF